MEKQCLAVIIGVGPKQDLGASLASFFAGQGLRVFIAGRSDDKQHPSAWTHELDLRPFKEPF